MSTMPASTEALRTKYEVLSNLWLLSQSRQPGKKMYADLSENTWPKFLKELLNEDNFGFQRTSKEKFGRPQPGLTDWSTSSSSVKRLSGCASKKAMASKKLSGQHSQIRSTG